MPVLCMELLIDEHFINIKTKPKVHINKEAQVQKGCFCFFESLRLVEVNEWLNQFLLERNTRNSF